MVYFEVGLMTMATYNSYKNSNSQQVDIRNSYFRPLHKYGIREAHYIREVRYDDPIWYYSSAEYRTREHNTFEIKFDQTGLEKLSLDLYKIEEEEWLRKNNPSLQAAWEHYQTVLGLVK